jgi:hypothetical protein
LCETDTWECTLLAPSTDPQNRTGHGGRRLDALPRRTRVGDPLPSFLLQNDGLRGSRHCTITCRRWSALSQLIAWKTPLPGDGLRPERIPPAAPTCKFFEGASRFPVYKPLCKAWAPLKAKFSLWLAVHGRLWTSDRGVRHVLQASPLCAFCDQEPETCDHLLAGWMLLCQADALFLRLISHQPAVVLSQSKPATSNQPAVLFSQSKSAPAISHQPSEQVAGMARRLGFAQPSYFPSLATPSPSHVDWWLQARRGLTTQRRKGLDSSIIMVSWLLWKARNRRGIR